jgi:putative salt-induced outer membrane protein YdiY
MACLASAGELRLENGAVLPGELVSIGTRTLAWKADKIGEVTVTKADVVFLHTSNRTTVKVAPDQATQADCLVAVTYGDWSVDCSDQLKSQVVAFANLNTPPPTTSSAGKFTVALDIDRGANPSEEINVDLNGRWLRPGHRHSVDVSIDYQETNNDVTEDDADANYQYDILRDRGWYWFGRTRYYRDKFEALNEVYAATGGIGRDFTPAEDLKLSLQGGPALMYYYYIDQDGQTEPGANLRWTAAWQTPWRGITASHSGEVGWVFSIADAYLFQSKTSLTFPLYQGLIAELRLQYDKSGVSVTNSGNHDLEWILALGYKW